jgi:hypothetical protein
MENFGEASKSHLKFACDKILGVNNDSLLNSVLPQDLEQTNYTLMFDEHFGYSAEKWL